MGIMANPMGRSIGINLPVYPLKGNIVTVPLKVKHKKKSQKIESSILSQLGTFRNECVQPRARFVDLSTQTQFGTNFRRRTGCRIQLEVISLSFCQNPWDYTTFFASYRFNTDGCESILENTQKVFRDGYIDASKAEYFAGLRPVSADDIPIIGKAIYYTASCHQ